MIAVVLAQKNYTAAADLQAKVEKEITEAEAKALITVPEGAASVRAREAAAMDARARRRAKYEEQYASKIASMLAAKDYAAAASRYEEMETHIKDEEAGAPLSPATGQGRTQVKGKGNGKGKAPGKGRGKGADKGAGKDNLQLS